MGRHSCVASPLASRVCELVVTGVLAALALVPVGLLFFGAPAAAQGAEAAEQEGNRLFDVALSLKDQGKWCEAAEQFSKSNDVWPDPKKIINIGVSQDKCGKLIESRATLQQFVRENEGLTAQSANVKKVKSFLETLSSRIPGVRLVPTGVVQGDVINLDGKPVDAAQAAENYIELNPGDHEVTIERRTGMAKREKFSVTAGERRTVEFNVPPPCPDLDGDNRCDEACVDRDLDGQCDKAGCTDWDEEQDLCLDGAGATPKDGGSILEEPVFWVVTGVVVAGLVVGGILILGGGDSDSKSPAKDSFGGPFKPVLNSTGAGLTF